jgi:murein DD-endopeptidase MepM/ murein hydrolase activator NlpD
MRKYKTCKNKIASGNNKSFYRNFSAAAALRLILKISIAIFYAAVFIFLSFVGFFYGPGQLFAGEGSSNNYYNPEIADTGKAPFIMPLDGDIVLGFRQDYFNGENDIGRKHTGIDIRGEFNQDVISSGNGVVSYTGFSPTGGRTIVVSHNEKIRTTYLNLLSIFVAPGEHVQQGEIIGSIGGIDDPSFLQESHLHFGVIYGGYYLDPEDVLKISYNNITGYIMLEYSEGDYYLK